MLERKCQWLSADCWWCILKKFTYDLRVLPFWLLQVYLEEVGGKLNQDNWFIGVGWKAKIEKIKDFESGSGKVSQIHLEWWGDERAIREILPQLEQKMLRSDG